MAYQKNTIEMLAAQRAAAGNLPLPSRRTCNKCGVEKEINAFGVRHKTKNWITKLVLVGTCKACQSARSIAEAKANPERTARARLKHRTSDEGKAYRRLERQREAERQGKTYRPLDERRADRAVAQEAERAAKEAKAAARVAARQAEIERCPWKAPGLSEAEAWRLQYELDPEFNVAERVRAGLRRKRQDTKLAKVVRSAVTRDGRSPTAETFLGYTMADLRAHLEARFTPGMTWEVFCTGAIHIDHIIPVDAFDVADPDELRRAWSLRNLRPLWASNNAAKLNKRLHPTAAVLARSIPVLIEDILPAWAERVALPIARVAVTLPA